MENREWLSRAECSALRAIAIMGIVLHNFCHWLDIEAKENEYLFRVSNNDGLWHALTSPDGMLPVSLLSYFGHYGVPVFVFLSGYGLARKYGSTPDLPVLGFIRHHYMKLFGMLVAGFVAYTLVDAVTPHPFPYRAEYIVAQLLMYINLTEHPSTFIHPGPYWFFGLMMQLYIIYRLLLHRRGMAVMAALVVVCWAVQAVCSPESESLRWLRYNSIGSVLPFCAGVLLGRAGKPLGRAGESLKHAGESLKHAGELPKQAVSLPSFFLNLRRRQWALLCVAALCVLLPMCFFYQTWFWAPLAVIVASVAFVKALPAAVMPAFTWISGVSAAMFVCHPITRKIFIETSLHRDVYAGLLLYIVSTVAVSWLFSKLLAKIDIKG